MKTVTIKFGSVDNATSFVKAIEDFESHFDLIYGQYVVDANDYGGNLPLYRSIIFSSNCMPKLDLPI